MAEPIASLPLAPTTTINAPTPAISFGQHAPAFDVLDLLPPAAAEKLRLLRLRVKESHAISVPFADIADASARRTDAKNLLARLTAHGSEGGFRLRDDDARVLTAERALEKAEAEFRRVQERQAARAAAFQTVSASLAACEDWLKNGRPGGTTLEAVEVDLPKPAKGENGLLDQIEGKRRRVRELRAAKHTVESAPYLSSVCKEKMRSEVAALAARGEPDVTLLIEHGGGIVWPDQRVQSEVYATERALAFAAVPDALAIVVWAHRDAITKQLTALIDSESDDKAALSDSDRELRLSEIESDILAVSRDESALVWSAQAQSLPVEHRADCNPQALLGIALVTKGNGHLEPTSPGFAYDLVQPYGGRRR